MRGGEGERRGRERGGGGREKGKGERKGREREGRGRDRKRRSVKEEKARKTLHYQTTIKGQLGRLIRQYSSYHATAM